MVLVYYAYITVIGILKSKQLAESCTFLSEKLSAVAYGEAAF